MSRCLFWSQLCVLVMCHRPIVLTAVLSFAMDLLDSLWNILFVEIGLQLMVSLLTEVLHISSS
jgi:hypothetical protein